MKNILLFALLILSGMFYTQNKYEIDLKEAKKYVDNIFKKDVSQIKNYVKLSDGRIMLSKTDDPIEEFDNDWNRFYRIIRKNGKVIFISQSNNLWGGIGDWYDAQDYYFNEKGNLIGAEKRLDFFLEETKCAKQIKYRAFYVNINAPKLAKAEKILNSNEKELNLDSQNCKSSKKQILNNIGEIDKITFRDLEGFMKAEKIKFYKN